MKKTTLALAAALSLAAGSAQAAPILLGEILHDYGSAAGKLNPGGNDNLSADFVIVSDQSSQRFNDVFDFSSLAYSSISSFKLTLNFAGTNNPFEDWRVRPGQSNYLPALQITNGNVVSQTFSFGPSVDTFSGAVASEAFSLWFAEEGFFAQSFRLYDAKLSVYGEAVSQAPANVPEPGVLALLGAGLLGGMVMRRKR
ncbi:PEP-CTERM sorting domain-containing protein [Niveibacterium sp. SC-1]|uniref:PEP-CTERM sorting domain-containing protein n=1 Tax=Niveibacterium sp. SC-1 TaxID=3135646 RepID=UPI00311ED504